MLFENFKDILEKLYINKAFQQIFTKVISAAWFQDSILYASDN